MKHWLRKQFINWLVKDIFHGIQKEDVLQVKNGRIYVAGEILTDAQANKLEKDAETIQNMYLWELLTKDMEYHSFNNGWRKAKTEEDMIVGKMSLYYISEMNNKLRDIASGWYTTGKRSSK